MQPVERIGKKQFRGHMMPESRRNRILKKAILSSLIISAILFFLGLFAVAVHFIEPTDYMAQARQRIPHCEPTSLHHLELKLGHAQDADPYRLVFVERGWTNITAWDNEISDGGFFGGTRTIHMIGGDCHQ